jgi:hypothetical protein
MKVFHLFMFKPSRTNERTSDRMNEWITYKRMFKRGEKIMDIFYDEEPQEWMKKVSNHNNIKNNNNNNNNNNDDDSGWW